MEIDSGSNVVFGTESFTASIEIIDITGSAFFRFNETCVVLSTNKNIDEFERATTNDLRFEISMVDITETIVTFSRDVEESNEVDVY